MHLIHFIRYVRHTSTQLNLSSWVPVATTSLCKQHPALVPKKAGSYTEIWCLCYFVPTLKCSLVSRWEMSVWPGTFAWKHLMWKRIVWNKSYLLPSVQKPPSTNPHTLRGNSSAASKHIKTSCNHTLSTVALSPTDGQFIHRCVFTSPLTALKFLTRADATSPRSAIEFNWTRTRKLWWMGLAGEEWNGDGGGISMADFTDCQSNSGREEGLRGQGMGNCMPIWDHLFIPNIWEQSHRQV